MQKGSRVQHQQRLTKRRDQECRQQAPLKEKMGNPLDVGAVEDGDILLESALHRET